MFEILTRHKDGRGNLTGYTIRDIETNEQKYISVAKAISLNNQISNAKLNKNVEYVAVKGCTIDTRVDNSNLLPMKQSKGQVNFKGEPLEFDYYGKGFINICRIIRKEACAGNVIVRKSKHASNGGRNTHLFKLIQACDLTLEQFIIGYLSVIQPYSLDYFMQKVNKPKEDVWLIDIGYKVKLVIKLESLKNNRQTVVVSFHESNIKGKLNTSAKQFTDKPCAVLIDKNPSERECDLYRVSYQVQRGFIRHEVISDVRYINKDVALVDYKDIDSKFHQSMQLILEGLDSMYYNSNENHDITPVIGKMQTNRLSFMSFGYNTVNNICFLLDLYSDMTSSNDRIILTEVANELIEEIPQIRKLDIKEALEEKWGKNNSNKLYNAVIGLLV